MAEALQVFEHGRLRVDERGFTERHFRVMARFHERVDSSLFSLGYNSIRFGHHVGVIQVEDLCIEVLPKTSNTADTKPWRLLLLEMLRACGYLKPDRTAPAKLDRWPRDLFSLFAADYISRVEVLLHAGLAKGYRTVEENSKVFRGRLVVPEHLRRNVSRADRLYLRHAVFDHRILANRILAQALRVVRSAQPDAALRSRAGACLLSLGDLQPVVASEQVFARLPRGRSLSRYGPALDLARLILLRHSPDLRAGEEHLISILVDVQRLFEGWIATLLRRLRVDGCRVRTQASQAFWKPEGARPSRLRPDLLVQTADSCVVLDTKWKVPGRDRPTPDDLRQMYAYDRFFEADETVLLYPRAHGRQRARTGKFLEGDRPCRTAYLELFQDGRPDPAGVVAQLRSLVGLGEAA